MNILSKLFALQPLNSVATTSATALLKQCGHRICKVRASRAAGSGEYSSGDLQR